MIGQNIKRYMRENGIKHRAVADKIGVSENTFSQMLNGKRKITAEEYYNICRVLKIPLSFLFETA